MMDGSTLYAAQEDVGLCRIDLRGGRFLSSRRIVEKVGEFGAPATYDRRSVPLR